MRTSEKSRKGRVGKAGTQKRRLMDCKGTLRDVWKARPGRQVPMADPPPGWWGLGPRPGLLASELA
jgi:hypothetical protein